MKHFCLCFVLFTFLPSWGQNPFVHINTELLDEAPVFYYGESLKTSSENNFDDETSMINYNPAIPFDGKQDYLEIVQEVSDYSQVTIFTVFKSQHKSSEEAEIWGLHGEETSFGLTTKRASSPSRDSYYTGSESNKVVLNTFSQSYGSSLPYPNKRSYISLGAINSETVNTLFKGSIAEIIGYKKMLRGSERQKIETALAIKYGITLTNEKNYINSDEKTIWDREDASKYSNNIAGIGRDDQMGVNQKQSSSSNEPGFLIIGAGIISTSNAKNTSNLNNNDFLVWGDNGADLVLKSEDNRTNEFQTLERQWLIKPTRTSAQDVRTQLKIDANSFSGGVKDKERLVLVIDRSGTGDFLSDDLEFVSASSISDAGIITFDNILWDTDYSGKDVFSFAVKNEPENILTDRKSNIKVFELLPNPSIDGNYRIIVETVEKTDVNIKIFNLQGIKVSDFEFKNEGEINISGNRIGTPGLYHVVLETPHEIISKKLIVE